MKNFIFLAICAFFTLSTQVLAMEGPKRDPLALSEVDLSAIESIKPISQGPISDMPGHMYKNCNQGTFHTWSPDYLVKLKKSVGNITAAGLEKKVGKPETQAYITAGEQYDWIHTCNFLESEYLKKQRRHLNLRDIKEINAHINRLTTKNNGVLRTEAAGWQLYTFSKAEYLLFNYFEKFGQRIMQGSDPVLHFDVENKAISTDGIVELLLYLEKNTNPSAVKDLVDATTYNVISQTLDIYEVIEWVKTCGSNNGKGIIYEKWRDARTHNFPSPDRIEDLLLDVLSTVNQSSMHPIIKAAYLWYELIRIHPFSEANKRTAKAAASLILLQNGYMPPVITGEDGKIYKDLLKTGFAKKDGHIAFITFIAKQIFKTQCNPEISKQVVAP